ncbi:MAG: OmpA family protein [Polyangiaceae bacterium]
MIPWGKDSTYYVLFKPGSSVLSNDMLAKVLPVVADGHRQQPDVQILLEGHADESEPDPTRLADHRVQTVRKKLIEMGVKRDAMVVRSFGAERPQEPRAHDGIPLPNAWVVIRVVRDE